MKVAKITGLVSIVVGSMLTNVGSAHAYTASADSLPETGGSLRPLVIAVSLALVGAVTVSVRRLLQQSA